MHTRQTRRVDSPRDGGFTLIEIVVAMFILALISLALLPLLIQGLQQSARSAAVASAVQLANSQLDLARAQSQTCTAIAATPAVTVGDASVYRGVPLAVTTSVGGCPSPTPSVTAPSTVTYGVTVKRTDTGAVLADVSTRLFVAGG
jgi:prepilin-type N-terminal cleavage/methylation domain-containing protein